MGDWGPGRRSKENQQGRAAKKQGMWGGGGKTRRKGKKSGEEGRCIRFEGRIAQRSKGDLLEKEE